MVNAVCEDIVRSQDLEQLKEFLSWCRFPFQQTGIPDFSDITSARFLVEQSFSHFGDLDLLILLDHKDLRKQAIMIEAKVSTKTPKTIKNQWESFLSFLGGNTKKNRSTLFVQIYRKLSLIERLADLNKPFKRHDIWGKQSLGSNRIVLKAAKLLAEYRANPWFVAFVSDDSKRVGSFFSDDLKKYKPQPQQLQFWDISRMGYLTWPDIQNHMDKPHTQSKWKRSLSTFKWNEDQIYHKNYLILGKIEAGKAAVWKGQRIVTVNKGVNPRAIDTDNQTNFFPKSFPVEQGPELKMLPEEDFNLDHHKPTKGKTYLWNPPEGEDYQPSNRAPAPQPEKLGTKVIVKNPNWIKTLVSLAKEAKNEEYGDFYVFTHHLEKNPLN